MLYQKEVSKEALHFVRGYLSTKTVVGLLAFPENKHIDVLNMNDSNHSVKPTKDEWKKLGGHIVVRIVLQYIHWKQKFP